MEGAQQLSTHSAESGSSKVVKLKKEHGSSKSDKGIGGRSSGEKSREVKRISYKVAIRKLPIQDFSGEDFKSRVEYLCEQLQLKTDNYAVEHYIEGKISRKRGPVYGTGFISFRDEDSLKKFVMSEVVAGSMEGKPSIPFLDGDFNSPEISLAAYQKTLRTKEKVDKLVGTYETDAEFLKFTEKFDTPAPKKPSAETLLDSKASVSTEKNDPKDSALLRYLREKAAKRMAERSGNKASSVLSLLRKSGERETGRKVKSSKSSKGSSDSVTSTESTTSSSLSSNKKSGSRRGGGGNSSSSKGGVGTGGVISPSQPVAILLSSSSGGPSKIKPIVKSIQPRQASETGTGNSAVKSAGGAGGSEGHDAKQKGGSLSGEKQSGSGGGGGRRSGTRGGGEKGEKGKGSNKSSRPPLSLDQDNFPPPPPPRILKADKSEGGGGDGGNR